MTLHDIIHSIKNLIVIITCDNIILLHTYTLNTFPLALRHYYNNFNFFFAGFACELTHLGSNYLFSLFLGSLHDIIHSTKSIIAIITFDNIILAHTSTFNSSLSVYYIIIAINFFLGFIAYELNHF